MNFNLWLGVFLKLQYLQGCLFVKVFVVLRLVPWCPVQKEHLGFCFGDKSSVGMVTV